MTPKLAEARLPANHRLVYAIVREQRRGAHLSMSDVYNLARSRRPGIGFTTVYRALARLRAEGLVSQIALPGADCAFYETAGAPHAHFRCTRCGIILDVDSPLSQSLADLGAGAGLRVERVEVTFHGLCAKCTANTPDALARMPRPRRCRRRAPFETPTSRDARR